jgi:hypothetical protein
MSSGKHEAAWRVVNERGKRKTETGGKGFEGRVGWKTLLTQTRKSDAENRPGSDRTATS